MKLEIRHLQKRYGEKTALKDLNLDLEPGIYGILGSNGAGKTTLMNLLTDNISRTEGEILWKGKDILDWRGEFRGRVGYMPQQQNLDTPLTVEGFLHYMAMLKGIPRGPAQAEWEEKLKQVNLWEQRKKRIASLSGGMKQRLLLAQALMGDPGLLLLDEPTAGLDPQERIRIRNLIAELSREKIVLLATHVVSDVECIADWILLLKEGVRVAFGTPYELIASLRGRVWERLCGKSDIHALQEKYPYGNLIQRKEGISFRVVGEERPEGFEAGTEEIGLEEVYLYYLEYQWQGA